MEKKTVLENLDLVLLTMDETVDGGCVMGHICLIHHPDGTQPPRSVAQCSMWWPAPGVKVALVRRLILETDPTTIAGRVAMRGPDDGNMSLTEQVGGALPISGVLCTMSCVCIRASLAMGAPL